MTARLAGLVSLGLGVVVLAACSSSGSFTAAIAGQPASAEAAPAAVGASDSPLVDRRVFLVGDSLTVGVATFLPALLDAANRPVTIDAQIGRTTSEGISILQQRVSEIGGTLVVALGTNDVPDPTEFAARIDQVMIIASGRKVIWATVARAGWDQLDGALFAAEGRWANLQVVDWRPTIAAHPWMLGADGVHLTVAGYELRAEWIAAALETTS